MYIRELSIKEFEEFAKNNEYANYHQTINYALLKSENDYEYEIIGFGDDETLYAAALVLVKLINGYLYAYVPEGYLIDFNNEMILKKFTEAIIDYYKKEDISFIKINPPVVIGEIDLKTHKTIYNDNIEIINSLKRCGYIKIKDNVNLESLLPQINAIVDLDTFDFDNLSKNTKNKIRKGNRKGLQVELADISKLDYLKEFTKRKINKSDFYFDDYYNAFQKNFAIDYFLVSIDYEKYMYNSNVAYEYELMRNGILNEKVRKIPGKRNINTKMNSDKTLLTYKNDISIASSKLNTNEKTYIGAALVVKYKNTATVLISGYDKKYKDYAPNYYLYYQIMEYYRNEYKYVNINGMTKDFSKNGRYHGLNEFKAGFKPRVVEYIGEFDLVINQRIYNKINKKGLYQKEFKQN